MPELNTFSIVARCPRTDQLGVAVATAVPAVGAICPFVRARVGAVSTQSWVNPYLAIEALERMAGGEDAETALEAVLAGDPGRELRQVGLVDGAGRAASWTGRDCTPWAGHHVGPGVAIQGNMLTGPDVVAAMAKAYAAATDAELSDRLLAALRAGDAAGGDMRGKQSAALRVHDREDYALLDLRVDEHAEPVRELARIHEIARLQLLPFVRGMPKREGGAEGPGDDVTSMLLKPPPLRPGGGGSAPTI